MISGVVFFWKMALVMLAGLNAIYFTVFDEAWALEPGEEAPITAKVVAVSALLLWIGVIYTGSASKQEEHGGFAQDDTQVMMLVSNPNFESSTVTSFVETSQVAPTILAAPGLDPSSLDAVQKEGTPVLPGLDFGNGVH